MGWLSKTLLLAIVLLATACGSFKQVTVSDYSEFERKSIKGSKMVLESTVKVNNPTKNTLYLKKVSCTVYRNGYTFAAISLPQKMAVLPKTSSSHTLSIALELKDPLAAVKLRDFDFESNEYTLSGYVKVGTCMFSKKIKFDNMAAKDLMLLLNSM